MGFNPQSNDIPKALCVFNHSPSAKAEGKGYSIISSFSAS